MSCNMETETASWDRKEKGPSEAVACCLLYSRENLGQQIQPIAELDSQADQALTMATFQGPLSLIFMTSVSSTVN